MKLVIIDNYDSFLYNLAYEFQSLGHHVTIVRNDLEYMQLVALIKEVDALVISPGPGAPSNAGHSMRLIKEFYPHKPMLGICLGHQAIVEAFGGKIEHAEQVVHGKVSKLNHQAQGLFSGFDNAISVARYHSLSAGKSPCKLPAALNVDAVADDDEVMAVSHKNYPVYGLQFHPESIMTRDGKQLLMNFVDQVMTTNKHQNQSGASHAAVA
ncbi:aminodeoxychorismate/anthranilate synthase component II [Kangiella sp. TOML190]|uniref:aminodeoxychorismate/anthranilate synthase component II n=1 Tax=Kangiella sp. TOML190 TaxID=2931351 RepID=UPI00203C093F|nr:aminodeoxychorismate/anthranilate synthase component II [Kangiella sp. TOML190]